MKTRRQFIKESLATGATLALSAGCGPNQEDNSGTGPRDIDVLRSNFQGQLILPGDQAYEAARAVFWRNPRTDKRPAVIARCADTEDVVRSMEFAVENDMPLTVRGGAHSFLGWGTDDNALVLDLSPMRAIAVDPVGRTGRAGAGVLAQAFVEAAGSTGLVAALGECPTVGIAGLTLGGGLGWLSGMHGATCDTVLSAEIVTTDGRTLVASQDQNSELFWAIRRGGGNFGVVTSLEYSLYPIEDVVAGSLRYRNTDVRPVLRLFAEIMENASDEFQARAIVTRQDGEPALRVELCWAGVPRDGEDVIRSLREGAVPLTDTVRQRTHSDFTAGEAGSGVTMSSAIKGSYLQRLTDEATDFVVDSVSTAPVPDPIIGLDHYMHGAVCRVAPDSTAFELRVPHAIHAFVVARWNDPAVAATSQRWIDDTWMQLKPFSAGRAYANYPAADGERAVRAAYGENYSRLASVKKRYDPGNMLRRNYNIDPERI